MRTVFMGTPDEATPSLRALAEVAEIDLVVTRPDRPRGRSRRILPPPVKQAAIEMGLQVAQPLSTRELMETVPPVDAGVVVAFGMILPPELLAIPRRGFLNVHFSLLPRWRGAAPVERVIMAGDVETGVTIIELDPGLDTGPIVATRSTPIEASDTGGSLRRRLAEMGADLLADTLGEWWSGRITPRPQPEHGTYAKRLTAEDRRLGSHLGAIEFVNRVRALAPAPGAQLWIEDRPHRILLASAAMPTIPSLTWTEQRGVPVLAVADGRVLIMAIQPPGKRVMTGEEWLRGRSLPGSGDGAGG